MRKLEFVCWFFLGLFFLAILLAFIGSAVTKSIVNDNPDIVISQEKKKELFEFAYQHFDNPIQRAFMVKIALDEKKGKSFYIGAYSFFGIRCEQVRITGGSARTVNTNKTCIRVWWAISSPLWFVYWIINGFSFG